MTVEELELELELDRIGATGWERATALRLAATIDNRGTASAAESLQKLMEKLASDVTPAGETSGVARIRATVAQITLIGTRRPARQIRKSGGVAVTTKGRRHA